MTIMIRDTTIVTSNPQRELLYNSAIVVDGGEITDIGPTEEMESHCSLFGFVSKKFQFYRKSSV